MLQRHFPLLTEAEVRAACSDLLADGIKDLDECERRLERHVQRLEEQLEPKPAAGERAQQYAAAKGWSASALERFCDPLYLALEAVDRTNAFRESRHLPQLEWSQPLAKAAREHARQMAQGLAQFSHEGFKKRLEGLPLDLGCAAENITYNSSRADAAGEAVQTWIRSPRHRGSLEDAAFNLCGVGVARASSGTFFFSQLLARASLSGLASEIGWACETTIEVRYPETYLLPHTDGPVRHNRVAWTGSRTGDHVHA